MAKDSAKDSSDNEYKNLSDNEIIEKINKNNKSNPNLENNLFKEIYNRYKEKISWLTYSYVRNHEDTKDITQEIFIKIYLSLSKFNTKTGNFKTWIYKIARNHIIDFKRKNKNKYKEVSVEDIGDIKGDEDIEIKEILEKEENLEKMKELLDKIPDKYKEVIILKLEGLSCKEIADIVDCNQNTVRWRLYRARNLIRKKRGKK